MQGIFPIDADHVLDQIAVCAIQRHKPASQVEQVSAGVVTKSPLVVSGYNINDESGTHPHASQIARCAQSLLSFDIFCRLPLISILHDVAMIVSQ